MKVPSPRLVRVNEASVQPERSSVLYWMTAARRIECNFAIDRALEWCRELKRPLVIFEAIRVDYPYASDRHHRFVLQGMLENFRAARALGIRYLPYVERSKGESKGLLKALADESAVVVTDDSPAFFLPRMRAKAGSSIDVLLEAVDGVGLLPIRSAERRFDTAHSFRRHVQKNLLKHFQFPDRAPFLDYSFAPSDLTVPTRWKISDEQELADASQLIRTLPIDHTVQEVPGENGGRQEGLRRVAAFLEKIGQYTEDRGEPSRAGTSSLSSYLHYGHVGTHELVDGVLRQAAWAPERMGSFNRGKKEGFWGLDTSSDHFLDQLVTWRELAMNTASRVPEYESYDSLPDWARRTLEKHGSDPREYVYEVAAFELGATHDRVFNASAQQLLRDGRIHNAMRMLWGKKILEWSATPQIAHRTLHHLNAKLALDGRDPNSSAGIGWVFGRYDRPFPPEKPVIGTLRPMSTRRALEKLDLSAYLERYSEEQQQARLPA